MAENASRRVVIPYSPRTQFAPYHRRSVRISVIVGHRRAGKTVAYVNDLIRRVVTCPRKEGLCALTAPLNTQAKDAAWACRKEYARPLLAAPPHESEPRGDVVNGARMRLYGGG
jgi:hypothetical protein